MSDTSTGDTGKSREKLEDDLSGAIAQLSVTTDSYDNASKSPKNLSDMPFDVVGLIIDRSDYKQQLILRKTSKSLRALVDKQRPACKSIQIECHMRSISITFNHHYVVYTSRLHNNAFSENMVRREDFTRVAFDDLASTLMNPKLQLEKFIVVDYLEKNKEKSEKYCNGIQSALGSLNHQVSVKKFELWVRSSSWLLSILPHLKPGVLEKITLIPLRGADWRIGMDKVALLEQWKQAKELELEDSLLKERFPVKYATHFKRYKIYGGWIDNDNLNRIKDFLSETELCTLSWLDFDINFFALHQLLGTPVSSNTTEEVFHHPIPDSDYYFEIKKARKALRLDIEKKKRENHR